MDHEDSVVSIFSRQVSYCRYREYKSVTEVRRPIQEVYEVFADFYGYEHWFGYCVDSYLVKDHSPSRKTAFLLIDTPWPIKDKYLLPDVFLERSFEDGNAIIEFELTDDSYSIAAGEYDPVQNLRGKCLLEKTGHKQTKITFICSMDPGGNIPVFFIEKFQLDQMVRTAENLHQRLELLFNFSPGVPEGDGLVNYQMPGF